MEVTGKTTFLCWLYLMEVTIVCVKGGRCPRQGYPLLLTSAHVSLSVMCTPTSAHLNWTNGGLSVLNIRIDSTCYIFSDIIMAVNMTEEIDIIVDTDNQLKFTSGQVLPAQQWDECRYSGCYRDRFDDRKYYNLSVVNCNWPITEDVLLARTSIVSISSLALTQSTGNVQPSVILNNNPSISIPVSTLHGLSTSAVLSSPSPSPESISGGVSSVIGSLLSVIALAATVTVLVFLAVILFIRSRKWDNNKWAFQYLEHKQSSWNIDQDLVRVEATPYMLPLSACSSASHIDKLDFGTLQESLSQTIDNSESHFDSFESKLENSTKEGTTWSETCNEKKLKLTDEMLEGHFTAPCSCTKIKTSSECRGSDSDYITTDNEG